MPGTTQPITHEGQLAGVVLSAAAADGRLTEYRLVEVNTANDNLELVQGTALYAMQIHESELPGPYDDDDALAYAHAAIELRHELTAQAPGRRGPGA
jgi:hypothetical protein